MRRPMVVLDAHKVDDYVVIYQPAWSQGIDPSDTRISFFPIDPVISTVLIKIPENF